MFHLRDDDSERRMTELATELRRLVWEAQASPRRARITLDVVIEDRRVSLLSEIVTRDQPLRRIDGRPRRGADLTRR